mmetsp:Transcript_30276/g.69801  ORF Transcript_30276/g.69801 Transcript_30276/m.69801 type:complete len:95 (-) Transcript_30276:149-433(-)|eukprot:CAMPEP_0116826498 /NCGR_PEP_ID=MMETSP0418-20121206/2560_1 /TAXON_ID=1158023 /ORGANISM="Astrosyne radiata, Strain 13vi08-1A" /LENGTH=94 /DNA_ID=CAMNT_0004455135 /DNA_START=319 /DNA_END=603 /DNA_ORIENTATION=+
MTTTNTTTAALSTSPLQFQHSSSKQRMRNTALPELENIALVEKNKQRKQQQDDLEPAFLNEKDYPPGWLVFHPVLGVVAKTDLDAYKKLEQKSR